MTSPTFVIARRHPGPGPALVHVDAYRLGGSVEVEDLDLDADLERAVTVVEWGAGKVEGLAADRLEVVIDREVGAAWTLRTPRVEHGRSGARGRLALDWPGAVSGIGWLVLILALDTATPAVGAAVLDTSTDQVLAGRLPGPCRPR